MVTWEKTAEDQFKKMIEKVPIFLREIAKDNVDKKAQKLVQADNRSEINEKDMVDAFFAATPFGFHGPMKCDMAELGIDYQKYGYPK